MLCVLMITAALSISEAFGGTGTPGSVRVAGTVLRIILLGLFALYSFAVPKAGRRASVLLASAAAVGTVIRSV